GPVPQGGVHGGSVRQRVVRAEAVRDERRGGDAVRLSPDPVRGAEGWAGGEVRDAAGEGGGQGGVLRPPARESVGAAAGAGEDRRQPAAVGGAGSRADAEAVNSEQ